MTPSTVTTPGASVDARQRSPRRRRWIWVTLVILLAVVIALAAWVGIRAFLAKGELEAAVPLVDTTRQHIIDGDTQAAEASARVLAGHASEAAALTGDPVWRVAELLPWAGVNLEGMQVIAASVDRVASGAVTPLA
ncbi:hypothetical protein [Agromyces larvae]|uniref:Uncharacterized protein n=1 Tax=Agromyces larvae TaxID=2929802 RepID=A0ABY4BYJ0_9MICO|nr:hypothetical protein [Agromyces larvae]UOE44315.1 hypothetical protein MTO99_00525 [Agromyces larvae]